jgi:hypothetical protein
MSQTHAPPALGPVDADALRGLLRAGLPLSAQTPAGPLLELRGVVARTADPRDRASRIRALDSLLRWQLARFEHPRLAGAARLLFGADRSSEGLSLTERREKAAAAADYEVHHFRKRIEPEICGHLARMLGAESEDLLSRAVPPLLAQSRTPLRLPADVFAWEAAEHEEHLAALWAAVYGLRSDLLAVARTASIHGPEHRATRRAADLALRALARVLGAAEVYRAAYGPILLGTDPPTDPADLARLAGWSPPLREPAAAHLARAAADCEKTADFLAYVNASPVATAAEDWRRSLLTASAPTTGDGH